MEPYVYGEAEAGSGHSVAIIIILELMGNGGVQICENTQFCYFAPDWPEFFIVGIDDLAIVGMGLPHDKAQLLDAALQLFARRLHIMNGQDGASKEAAGELLCYGVQRIVCLLAGRYALLGGKDVDTGGQADDGLFDLNLVHDLDPLFSKIKQFKTEFVLTHVNAVEPIDRIILFLVSRSTLVRACKASTEQMS